MPDTIALIGLVATTPKHLVTAENLSITSFRLASHQRRFDRAQGKWADAETNWYTVTAFRQLSKNVIASVQKGQRIVVVGRLRVRDWQTDDKKGTNVEVDAEAIGHDLTWGTSAFTRSASAALPGTDTDPGEADPAGADPGDTADEGADPGLTADGGAADDGAGASTPAAGSGVALEPEAVGASTPF